MDSTRALKRLLFLAVAFFASVVMLGVVTTPDDTNNGPTTRPATVSVYSHDELQRAADMTDQMSAPGANTGSQAHADEQLQRCPVAPVRTHVGRILMNLDLRDRVQAVILA